MCDPHPLTIRPSRAPHPERHYRPRTSMEPTHLTQFRTISSADGRMSFAQDKFCCKDMRYQSRPKPPPEDPLGGYEYHCGGCVTSFFNEKAHRKIEGNGAGGEGCGGELILLGQPGDPS